MYQHERIKGVNVCIVVIYLYQWLAVISFVSCGFVHCSCCSISDARRSIDDYNCTVASTVPVQYQVELELASYIRSYIDFQQYDEGICCVLVVAAW